MKENLSFPGTRNPSARIGRWARFGKYTPVCVAAAFACASYGGGLACSKGDPATVAAQENLDGLDNVTGAGRQAFTNHTMTTADQVLSILDGPRASGEPGATVAARAEGDLDEASNPSDVDAVDFALMADPPGGSWSRTCTPGRSVPSGYCTRCRRRDGTLPRAETCIYTFQCPEWCAWNNDGSLQCGNC